MIRSTFLMILTVWLSYYVLTSMSYALTASTAKSIIGNSPQFNAQLEQEIAQRRFSLLKFNYLQQVYPDEQGMPLIDPWQTIQNFTEQVALNPIILNEDDTIDIDGDGEITSAFITTSITVLDKNNQILDPNSTFCESVDKAPMTLQLSAQLNLSSRYGVPNTTPYSVVQQYTLAFKPTICYLKPSLIYGGGKYAGIASVWNPQQGFIYDESKTNFPTTGMNGLNYDIKVLGVDVLVAEDINMIYSKTANVDLLLTPVDSQTLNVKLSGPSANNPKTFTPNIFTIMIGPTITYRFKINNWFIHNNDKSLAWANTNSWCNQLGGSQRYILPAIAQLSNASFSRDYTRAIGGLLPEWGSLVSYDLMTSGYIWSGTKSPYNGYYDAHNASGFVSSPVLTFEEKSMCVSK